MTTMATEPDVKMGRSMGDFICNLSLMVKGWTGQIKVPDDRLEQQVRASDGTMVPVNNEDSTGTCLKLRQVDDIFERLERNRSDIYATMSRFTTGSGKSGIHLISTFAVGDLILELDSLREMRTQLVDELVGRWVEIVQKIVDRYPQHTTMVLPKLPDPKTLHARHSVYWEFQPLNPIRGEDLDLTKLSSADQRRLIARTNEMGQSAVRSAMDNVLTQVFGELSTVCDEIVDGQLGSNRVRSGYLNRIMSTLERVANFGTFATPRLLERVSNVRNMLSGVTPQDINANANRIVDAVRQAMGEIRTDVGDTVRNIEATYASAAGYRDVAI